MGLKLLDNFYILPPVNAIHEPICIFKINVNDDKIIHIKMRQLSEYNLLSEKPSTGYEMLNYIKEEYERKYINLLNLNDENINDNENNNDECIDNFIKRTDVKTFTWEEEYSPDQAIFCDRTLFSGHFVKGITYDQYVYKCIEQIINYLDFVWNKEYRIGVDK